MRPTTANSSPAMMPCENICSTAPLKADGVERRQAEQHKAHVAHAGIADDKFEVALHQRHARAINDADDGQRGNRPATFARLRGTKPSPRAGSRKRRASSPRRPAAWNRRSARPRDRSAPRCETATGRPEWRSRRTPAETPSAGNPTGRRHLRQFNQIQRAWPVLRARHDPRGDQADEHQMAADERIQRQFHRAVFLARAAPARDEEIFRDDRQFVKHEQQQHIEAQEHAIHAADEREVEGEKFLRALLDVPGKQNARHGRQAGQDHQHQADAVRREIIFCAEAESSPP
jgi:hypothetical protein